MKQDIFQEMGIFHHPLNEDDIMMNTFTKTLPVYEVNKLLHNANKQNTIMDIE